MHWSLWLQPINELVLRVVKLGNFKPRRTQTPLSAEHYTHYKKRLKKKKKIRNPRTPFMEFFWTSTIKNLLIMKDKREENGRSKGVPTLRRSEKT